MDIYCFLYFSSLYNRPSNGILQNINEEEQEMDKENKYV
jgi:hypothetical protein